MTLPEQHLPKRRPQILDNDTRDEHRFDVCDHENTRTDEDTWVRIFTARLAELVRKIGGKS